MEAKKQGYKKVLTRGNNVKIRGKFLESRKERKAWARVLLINL